MIKSVSIVVPLYNEEDNVELLCRDIAAHCADLPGIEVVLVDDGSSDATLSEARRMMLEMPMIKVVELDGNFGQTAAMAAGVELASGEVVVTMDGDLQNDPRDIPRLLALIDQGNDIAVGWRKKRRDGGARVFISKVANRMMGRILGVQVQDSGCSLKAYKAPLIKGIPLYGEMHRFIPALCSLAGAKLAEIEVNHRARQFGVSKYGFSRIQKVFFDIISIRALLSYARHPLQWIQWPLLFGLLPAFGVLAFAYFTDGTVSVIEAACAFVFFSFSIFILAWGLLGALFAQIEPSVARYARLAAGLPSGNRDALEQLVDQAEHG